VSVFSVGAGVFLHEFQQHAWWSGTREPFHVQNDWAYAMSADKLGHIFVGSLINKTLHDVFIWSGLEDKTALWFASIFSIGYMTDIEIEDGFARAWGYSPGDEISNLTGDVYAISRSLWAPMRNVSFKWSYFPTGDPQHKGDFPDDYNGQVFWLSFTMHNFLSGNIQKYWPSFFNLAVGYGVAKYDDVGPGSRTQYIYMGLDYDFRYIIPGNSEFMKWIKEFINNFKFIPTPALRWNTSTGKFDVIIHL